MVPPLTADGGGIKFRGRARRASTGRRQANDSVSRNSRRINQNTHGRLEGTVNSRRSGLSIEPKSDTPNGRALRRAKPTTKQQPSDAPKANRETETAQTLQSFQDRYQILKVARDRERAEAIARGVLSDPNKPRTLAEAITPKGTCQDMCPEFERVERVVQNDVWAAEASSKSPEHSRQLPVESRMVKKFRRAAAGLDEQLPSDLRPPPVLQMTVAYLFDTVVGEADSLASVHHFVWDRTRAIRNDFSIQQITKASDLRIAIDCYERIARFHILSLHQLALPEKPYDKYDAQQEREQLDKTLLSLMQYYDDSRSIMRSKNEAEFRAYCIIFQIQDPVADLEDRVQTLPPEILHNSRVQRALALYAAASNTNDSQGPLKPRISHLIGQANWRKFWTLVFSNEVSYLMACVAEIYFGLMRRTAINSIWHSYRRGGNSMNTDWSLDELIPVLGFENEDQVQDFCEQYGFSVSEQSDGTAYVELESISGRQLPEPTSPSHKQIRSTLVEYKRYDRMFPAVIRGFTVQEAAEAGMLEGASDDELIDDFTQSKPLFVADAKTIPSTGPAGQLLNQGTPPFTPALPTAIDEVKADDTVVPSKHLGTPVLSDSLLDSVQTSSLSSQLGKSITATSSQFVPRSGHTSLPPPTTSDSATTPIPKIPPIDRLSPPVPSSIQPYTTSTTSGPVLYQSHDDQNMPSIETSNHTKSFLSKSNDPTHSRQSFWSDGVETSSQKTLPSFPPEQSATSVFAAQADQNPVGSSSSLAPSKTPSSLSSAIPQHRFDFPQFVAQASTIAGKTSHVTSQPFSHFPNFNPGNTNLAPASITRQSSATPLTTSQMFPSPAHQLGATDQVQTDVNRSVEDSNRKTDPPGPKSDPEVQLNIREEKRAKQAAEVLARQAAEELRALQERKSELINDLANVTMFERHGLMNQYIEHLAGPLIRAAQQRVEREELRHGADAFRVKILSQRYGERWRHIVWEKQVKRRGRERRKRQSRNRNASSPHLQVTDPQIYLESTDEGRDAGLGPTETVSSVFPADANAVVRFSAASLGRQEDMMLASTISNEGTSIAKVKSHDAQDAERRLQRLSRHPLDDALQRRELIPSRGYSASEGPKSTPSSAFGNPPLYLPQRTDTTRSSYFKLKALGISKHSSTDPHFMHNTLSDLKRQRSLEPDTDAARHSKRKALGTTQSLDLNQNLLLVPRRAHQELTRRPQTERSESDMAASSATAEERTVRMPKNHEELGNDEDERVFAAARSTRQAITDSILFFKEESARSRTDGHGPQTSSHIRGAALLRGSAINDRLPRAPSTSETDTTTSKHHPPRFRARVGRFLRRDDYAQRAETTFDDCVQSPTSSPQQHSRNHKFPSTQPVRRRASGGYSHGNTRPFTESLFGPRRYIEVKHDAMGRSITSTVDAEDDDDEDQEDKSDAEGVNAEERERRKKGRALNGSAIEPLGSKLRNRLESDNVIGGGGASDSDGPDSESVTSLEGDELEYELNVEVETEEEEASNEKAQGRGVEAPGHRDAWASKSGTSFDDAIEL